MRASCFCKIRQSRLNSSFVTRVQSLPPLKYLLSSMNQFSFRPFGTTKRGLATPLLIANSIAVKVLPVPVSQISAVLWGNFFRIFFWWAKSFFDTLDEIFFFKGVVIHSDQSLFIKKYKL